MSKRVFFLFLCLGLSLAGGIFFVYQTFCFLM